MQGLKTATSALLWEYEAKGKTPPHAGDLSIVTNWHGEPLCVIETIEVTTVPFSAVDERFTSDMPVVCERFRVVFRRKD